MEQRTYSWLSKIHTFFKFKQDTRETVVVWMWSEIQWKQLGCAEMHIYSFKFYVSYWSHSAFIFSLKVWFRCTTLACWGSKGPVLVNQIPTSIYAVAFQETPINWEIILDWSINILTLFRNCVSEFVIRNITRNFQLNFIINSIDQTIIWAEIAHLHS